MEVIGIIAEYNPLHNGHIYQINNIKEIYPNSLIIVILNGNFTQRGDISFISKEEKTKLALENNIDIVLELPTIYGTQSSDIFAYQAIKILNEFNITKLCFGSESNDLKTLKNIASIQEEESFNDKLKQELDKGLSYPNALKNIIDIKFNYLPNDLLGISYIKAINKINKDIDILLIKRTNNYHDKVSNDNIISAENIRNKYINNEDISNYCKVKKLNIPNYDLYFMLIKHKLLTDSNLNTYVDVNEGIENRLIKYIKTSNNLIDFINKVKTKRYTYNKISRMLIHILLGFKKEDNKDYTSNKILGFNLKGQKYLNTLDIKIKQDKFIKDFEIRSSIIYDMLNNSNSYLFEIKNKPIKN